MKAPRPREHLRILALTNLYPPHYVGGYELGCQQVMERLVQRGHRVVVLTSTHGVNVPRAEGHIHRVLPRDDSWAPDQGLMRMALQETESRRHLKQLLTTFRPDIALAWSLEGLANGLLPVFQKCRVPVVCGVSDYWIMNRPQFNHWVRFWHLPAVKAVSRWLKPVVRVLVSRLLPTQPPDIPWEHAFFTSHALRHHYEEAGMPVADSRVIYWGVDSDTLVQHCGSGRDAREAPRLLYAGRLVEPKGVHTFLEALPHVPVKGRKPLRVSLVGEGPPGPYLDRLHEQAAALDGKWEVWRPGRIPADRMPEVYRTHNVLVFPSIWEEPFSLTLLEAMAAGLCVVASTAGGSAEILQHDVNSLTFAPGDARDLARQLQRVLDDPGLRVKLAREGQRQVCQKFSWAGTVQQVEQMLYDVLGRTPAPVRNAATS